jgi:hypothetical protein
MAEGLMAVRQQPVQFVGIVVNHFHFHLRTAAKIEGANETVATQLADVYVAPAIVAIGGMTLMPTMSCIVKFIKPSY